MGPMLHSEEKNEHVCFDLDWIDHHRIIFELLCSPLFVFIVTFAVY